MSAAPTLLARLEADAIHILREVAAGCERPVLLFSGGKDSAVLLHLAVKAFAPGPLPFPLLHVDTGCKPAELIAARDRAAAAAGARLLVERDEASIAAGTRPEALGTERCCAALKTGALRAALARHRFDAAIGGARREEEKARAKERVFSLRDAAGQWDPRRQRPEPWDLFTTRVAPGESLRVFPLSDWTERDVWRYIAEERIEVAPLYFAAPRRVVARDGRLFLAEPGDPGSTVETVVCRFRTLGCAPCTAAIRSEAGDVAAILAELATVRSGERAGRMIDLDSEAALERKKREGYF